MKRLAFCEYCMREIQYEINEVNKMSVIKDEEISYIAKKAVCCECNNEIFVSEICDYNLNSSYEEYRNLHNIIKIEDIKRIILKYSINEEALSLLLGWGCETIGRYLDGDMICSSNSDILKKMYKNTNYYSILLQTNKGRINPVDYNKSRQAVKAVLNKDITEEKIDAVIKHILIRCEDITPLTIQKLLYYVQGFYYMFTDNFIFQEDCEASVKGPIYASVKERYEHFGFEIINNDILSNENLKLEDAERNAVESIIKFFGCYSGKILEQMVKNEAPWMLTRTKTIKDNHIQENAENNIIEKNSIGIYFKGLKEKYNMTNLLDVQKYSTDLFNSLSM
ncbi:type II toxin-antitoxin system antitoxin SocA domain-containing protein [Clostridium sp. C2-6-12]|uniref:type II toxin-antitoxin system antitoxin SocA domain-containing protein n=1 Tax=Clostridium sp. C2-6-12 TaxID=2698832 RepID=UPI00136D2811|nr:type II toxin-antitoxin system antitoxin SocA domain-containing protein [Clostridium sp. C2-6-12]